MSGNMHGTGSFKTCYNSAVTKKNLKRNFDLNVLANFRLVSDLPFISKILEKAVLQQLLSFLEKE